MTATIDHRRFPALRSTGGDVSRSGDAFVGVARGPLEG